jgi:hypothetical protein
MIPKAKLQKGCNVSDLQSGRPGSQLVDNIHYTEWVSGFLQAIQEHVTIAHQSVNHTSAPNPPTFIINLSPNHSTQYNKI